ncbi:dihydrodipicolinate synthetase [Fusarium heterosporum]|uniref:Dihydrodipicolinate synthetase n=1 Tax=Fusarium heterosporum TaxID=42747 RepID=A0A8H5TSH9_FUSHE|nr:dihydrodipicolinate synthetase [Fusarium heterosporum]
MGPEVSNNSHASPAFASQSPPLHAGLYVPTVAFFSSDESIDVETTKLHAKRLIEAGVSGLVTHGSSGEAVHLDHNERQLIIRATRDAINEARRPGIPLIAGCGAQSTQEAVQLCHEAAESGSNYALVLPPAYYGILLTTQHIIQHFLAIADHSPIPILIYNFPGACSGLDLSSDIIIDLAGHPKIVGVKLTCGNTGKLARIVDATARNNGRGGNKSFRTFGGSVDFTLPTLVIGGHGIIGGTGNIAPRACMKLFTLWEQRKLDEARQLQAVVARGDWAAIEGGFVSIKAALQHYCGYGGMPRKPCTLLEGEAASKQLAGFSELMILEQSLEE